MNLKKVCYKYVVLLPTTVANVADPRTTSKNLIYRYPTDLSISYSFLDIVKTRPKCNLYTESIVMRVV
jgi:hypothetical protein